MPVLSAWAVRRPIIALISWFIAVAAVVGLGLTVGGDLNDSFDLPDTESKVATDLLTSSGTDTSRLDSGATIVWSPTTGTAVDEATAAVGLVYPVFPGENSASLGGNVATNAGGQTAPGTLEITVVPASHDSTVPRALLSEEERKHLEADNVSLQLGQPTGYVIQFSNGLVAYLTGDTGMFAEMKTTMADFHKVNLIELNLGYSALNAAAAAHIVNELVKPASVILSHVNEGATTGGKVKGGTHTADFLARVKGRPVHLALSGKTMEFDGGGKCVSGCSAP